MIDRRTFSRLPALGTGTAAVRSAAANAPAVPVPQGTGAAARTGDCPGTSFAWLAHVRAGLLDAGYAEAGPPRGPAVLCLHGRPYDIHSFVGLTPLLAARGYRVIVPYLRGHGSAPPGRSATPSSRRSPSTSWP